MKYTDTVIIGGGQAGLAMSHCLWECGVKHVDCLHNMGDPHEAVQRARQVLKNDGTVTLGRTDGRRPTRGQPQPRRPGVLRLLDHDLHTSASLSQEGRYGLGAQAGEARLSEVLTHSGFGIVRRAAETPFNLILEARP